MKRVIQFSRARYFFYAFSALLVLVGVVGYIVNHGFNAGVDFRAGISVQFQIAPPAFSLMYLGTQKAEVSVPVGEGALTAPGDFIVTVTDPESGVKQTFPFHYTGFKTVKDLTQALGQVPGVTVQPLGNLDVPPSRILPPVSIADITGKAVVFNEAPPEGAPATKISDIRAILAPMGQFELQGAGKPSDQQFMARFQAPSDDPNFQTQTLAKVQELLGAKYGQNDVMIISSEFVGPRLSQALASQSVWLVIIAVFLILLYMIFRFHPAIYGVAAIIAICHDAFVMLAFDTVFRVEIDAATIAAVLTILGYSINDTIVIFDRVRENNNLMRGQALRGILDTSVTQTLSRTFITSGATLLTVIALFVLTTGSMKNFALNMIVGIVEGTYSTFIANFVVLEWMEARDRRRKKREATKYGISTAKPQAEEIEAQDEEEVPASAPARQAAAAAPAVENGQDGVAASVAPTGDGQSPGGSDNGGSDADAPAGKIASYPGQNPAYRRHKRHKRRHH